MNMAYKIAREFYIANKIAVEFNTEEEKRQYQKDHDVRPTTKLEVKENQNKQKIPIKESAMNKKQRLSAGYTNIVTIDAEQFKKAFEKEHKEPLNWSQARMDHLKDLESFDKYPWVTGKDWAGDDTVNVSDGRHRISTAAAQHKLIDVATHPDFPLPDELIYKGVADELSDKIVEKFNLDQEYEEAVDHEDYEKLNKMVQEQAQKNGYHTTTWRGDSDAHNNFAHRREPGIFTSQDKDFADEYGERGRGRGGYGVTRKFMIKGKVLDLNEYNNADWIRNWAEGQDEDEWIDRRTGEPADPVEVIESGTLFDWEGDWSGRLWKDLQRSAKYDGYDILITPDKGGVEEAMSTIVLTPENIKLADPVTYDDDGNLIPLSKRFDNTTNDVRY